MNREEEYGEENLLYSDRIASEEGTRILPCNISYRVIQAGTGKVSPSRENVVSVRYRGVLTNGREFDSSWKWGCPEAFRLNQVIEGWQLALQEMRVGDRWIIYIPHNSGHDNHALTPISVFPTLAFEVGLLGVA